MAGMTQSGLAEWAGVSRNAYRRIETGATEPRTDTLQKIAHALELDVHELLKPVRGLEQVRFRALRGSKATKQRELGQWIAKPGGGQSILARR